MSGGCVKYSDFNEIMGQDSLQRLRSQIKRKGVVPFIGAGISVPYGFPGWTSFLIEKAQFLGVGEVENLLSCGKFEEAASSLVEAYPQFREEVKSTFGRREIIIKNGSAAELLLSVFKSGPFFTTNFDRVIETIFDRFNRPLNIVSRQGNIKDALELRDNTLIKLHGDAADDENRVLTYEEYNKHYGTVEELAADPLPERMQALVELFCTDSVLFVGCGLQNDRYLQVLKNLKARPTRYAILPYQLEKKRLLLLDQCGIRPIWYATGRNGNHDGLTAILRYLADLPPIQLVGVRLELTVSINDNILERIERILSQDNKYKSVRTDEIIRALRSRFGEDPNYLKILNVNESTVLVSNPRFFDTETRQKKDKIDLSDPHQTSRLYRILTATGCPLDLSFEGNPLRSISLVDKTTDLSIVINFHF